MGSTEIRQIMLPYMHHVLFSIINLYFGIYAVSPIFLAAGKIILKTKQKEHFSPSFHNSILKM